jgi:hypothetical protein
MKKKIITILSVWIALSIGFGIYYINFGPKKPQKILNMQPISSGYKAAKEPFRSLALEIVSIELRQTKQNKKPFIKKMYEFGAKNIIIKTETNSSEVAKTLPDVIIGGKKFKEKQTCTIVSYKYKGKNYEAGNCK